MLLADPGAGAVLAEAGFDVLSLSNNHTADAGSAGIIDTVKDTRFENLKVITCGKRVASPTGLLQADRLSSILSELKFYFDTVIIEHIPKLTKAKRNEAKRFVILIDALYDNHVRLVASAETAPEGIYPEGDHAFEFARTASRLNEMQSEEWLSSR